MPMEREVGVLLASFAENGDIVGVGKTLKEVQGRVGGSPAREYLAALVDAHLARGDPHAAVRTLHHFESIHLTLPEHTYTSVLSALLPSSPTMRQRDKHHAWDLFTHMRLVAYPTPSVESYNTMIRACADPKDPQPELALDLFTQMVAENAQQPLGGTYSVLIKALARVKGYYFHAFRVLRQMLEVHQASLLRVQDGQGTGYEPTTGTFNALLEGTKRSGDLGRARWILAEMAKVAAFVGTQEGAALGMMPNEETLVGVFHTYAAYKPVIARGDVKVAEASPGKDGEAAGDAEPEHEERAPVEQRQVSLMDIGSPDFIPPYQPQTSYEVFSEATQLFDLVLDNITTRHGAFSHVRPSARLVNAYLSVALAHAPLDRAVKMQLGLWHDLRLVKLGVKPNGWTYLFALERCAAARNKTERKFVGEALETLWVGYIKWFTRQEQGKGENEEERYRLDVGLGPREVERCWVAAIRGFAL